MKMKFYLWDIFIVSTCLFRMNTVNSQKTSNLKEKKKVTKLAIYLENSRPHKTSSLFSVNHRKAEVVRDLRRLPSPTPVPKAESTRAGFLGLSPAGFWIFSKYFQKLSGWPVCFALSDKITGSRGWCRTSISLLTKSDSQADFRRQIKRANIFLSWGHSFTSIFTTQPSRDWCAVICPCMIHSAIDLMSLVMHGILSVYVYR